MDRRSFLRRSAWATAGLALAAPLLAACGGDDDNEDEEDDD